MDDEIFVSDATLGADPGADTPWFTVDPTSFQEFSNQVDILVGQRRSVSFPSRSERRSSSPAPDGARNTENLDLSNIVI